MHSDYLRSDRRDRAKAAAAALAINLLLGAAFLTGLALHVDQRRDSGLVTFDVTPPPLPEAPDDEPEQAIARAPSPAGQKASPTAIVAPPARVPVEPMVAAVVAGAGAVADSDAATSGTGAGAGGSADGLGGVGGGGGPVIGAKLLSGALTRADYRRIVDLGSSRGTAELLLLVNPLGQVERCRATSSSGKVTVDAALCQMLLDRARFAPAHSADGTRYYQDVHYFPRWGR